MTDCVTATVAARALGLSLAGLRTWRRRNPDVLPVVTYGWHGQAIYRFTDVQHAQTLRASVLASHP